ncbi:hypothetical protein P3T16_002650 [Paraburkholderia sp. GAS42]
MKLASYWFKVALVAVLLLTGRAAFAQPPVGCGDGNQDAQCLTPTYQAPQIQPACSTAAGWTTAAAAQWIGSRWTSPTCNYQAEPVCPPGDTTVSPAVWTGSTWTAPSCAAPPPIPPSTPDPMTSCQTSVPSGFSLAGFMNANGHDPSFPGDAVLEWNGSGPVYETECHGGQNLYFLMCSVSPGGNVDRWTQTQVVFDGNCGH